MNEIRNPRQRAILAALGDGPVTTEKLLERYDTEMHDGAPLPSIRRAIGVLRDRGYDIRYENKQYTHVASPVAVTTT